MPIDPTMKDAMLGTFKNMAQECKDKNYSGEDFDIMIETYNRMEELAETHNDLNAFNGQVMQENLFGKFSEYYSKVLSNAAAQSSQGADGEYDDKAMLNQALDGLRSTIQSIRDAKKAALDETQSYDPKKAAADGVNFVKRNSNFKKATFDGMEKTATKNVENELKERPNAFENTAEINVLFDEEAIILPIENLLKLGEQEDMTLPRFLRIQIEKGLDKIADGTKLHKDVYIFELEWAKSSALSPYHIQKAEERIELYDALAAKSSFTIPNSKELAYENEKLDRKHQPDIILWQEIENRWEDLLWQLSFWALSYCKFAAGIQPWSLAKNPQEAVIRTQDISPGIIKEKEKLLKKYFGISFMDIFNLPSFEWQVKHFTVDYSQEYVEFLIKKVYPECKPFNHLPADTILQKENFYTDKKESNPETHLILDNFIKFYDGKFGEGRYASKFPMPEYPESNAAVWDFDDFKGKIK